ncbi:unnamed protein product [Heterosigma akashiwo]|mmetsp:Transcript_12936/g.20174  ORF Transcript_12936/g.20174 Transcript_12936/m.20174 type:complete len:236 (-) Transcript_12936:164-871(-)
MQHNVPKRVLGRIMAEKRDSTGRFVGFDQALPFLASRQEWHDLFVFASCCREFRVAACKFARLQVPQHDIIQTRDFPRERISLCAATGQTAAVLRGLSGWQESTEAGCGGSVMGKVKQFFQRAEGLLSGKEQLPKEVLVAKICTDVASWVLQRNFEVHCSTTQQVNDDSTTTRNFGMVLFDEKNDCFYLRCTNMTTPPAQQPKLATTNIIVDQYSTGPFHFSNRKRFSPFEDFSF